MKLPGTTKHWKKQGRILPHSFQRKCGLPAILILDSSLQDCERLKCCCFKPPSIYYLQQPQKTKTRICCLVTKLCLTLCNPMDCSPPDFSVHWVFQARILEWIVMPSSRGFNQCIIINEIFAIPFIKIICRMWCVFYNDSTSTHFGLTSLQVPVTIWSQ